MVECGNNKIRTEIEFHQQHSGTFAPYPLSRLLSANHCKENEFNRTNAQIDEFMKRIMSKIKKGFNYANMKLGNITFKFPDPTYFFKLIFTVRSMRRFLMCNRAKQTTFVIPYISVQYKEDPQYPGKI